jgi:hypothetical protein
MSRRLVAVLAALVACGLAAEAGAQGLGDTAAKERRRRAEAAKKASGAKVFTNDDLDAGRPPGSKPSPAPEAGAPVRQEDPPPAPSEPTRQEQEGPFLDAIRAAEAEVAGAEAAVRELQAKLNPMSTSYIYGPSGSNDANEELRVREQIRQAEGQLRSAREALLAANQSLQDFRQGRAAAPLVER